MIYTNYKETVGEDGGRRFSCNVCSKQFKKHELFGQHYRTVHLNRKPKKLRVCPYCDVEVSPHKRAFHLEKAHGEPAPSCGACGKKFAFPGQVLRHQKFHHMGENQHRCEACNMSFISRWKLTEHQKKHRPDYRPFECEVCAKCFRWRNNLKTHMNTHTNNKPHVCKACGVGFAQHASLSYHVKRMHSDQ